MLVARIPIFFFVSRAGARRAQTEGRFWGGYPSSAGIDEGWTLIRKAALEVFAFLCG
jgi:hypothetical protein